MSNDNTDTLEGYARDAARDFAKRGYTQEQAENAFVAGAQWIQTYITEWSQSNEQQSDKNNTDDQGVGS